MSQPLHLDRGTAGHESRHQDRAALPVASPGLFFRRWLANPLQMGSIVPSSPALCRRVVLHAACAPDKMVVELGAGTGVISRALLDAGLSPDRLVLVEIVPALAEHLRRSLPGVTVIQGDARDLPVLLKGLSSAIGAAICGVPLVLLPLVEQRRFVEAFTAVAPDCGFLHYSYCITSPISTSKLGLSAQRLAWTPLNFPPASVWRYRSTQAGPAEGRSRCAEVHHGTAADGRDRRFALTNPGDVR